MAIPSDHKMSVLENSRNTSLLKRLVLFAWLLVPIAVIALHFGPGQDHLGRDKAGFLTGAAEAAAMRSDWQEAEVLLNRALHALPEDAHYDRRRLEIAHAKARIYSGDMIAGQEQLQNLIEEMEQAPVVEADLMAAARHELATASYHAAWIMRLEGASADEWKPETTRARQQFRLLAEEAAEDDADRESFAKNVEATIKLEQMDLATLLARPPPSNCPKACKNLSQRKRKQCQSRCRSSGKKKQKGSEDQPPQDVRQQVKQQRGAGMRVRGAAGS